MSSPLPVAVIVGAGPGLGQALAQRFAEGGYAIAALTRTQKSREDALKNVDQQGVQAAGFNCDVGNRHSVSKAFAHVRDDLGEPEVLIYNAGFMARSGILEMSPEYFESAWRTNCFGGYLCAREVLPGMVHAQKGTIILTGATASLRSGAKFAAFASAKFGLRALSQSLAREYGPKGIHTAHTILDGQIATPKNLEKGLDPATLLAPGDIAQNYWQLHQQPKSTWTQELDIRPFCETF